jgi:carboxymethylenebutenolidase
MQNEVRLFLGRVRTWMETKSQSTTFRCSSDGVEMIAYLSQPVSSGQQEQQQYPAIIVIHEAWCLNEQIKGVATRYAEQGFVAIAPHLFTRHTDLLTENNIKRAMALMFSIPPEKRNDPSTIENIMKSATETDGKILHFFFSGRDALEKVMADDIISCVNYLTNLEYVKKDRLGITGFCLGGGLAYQLSTMYPFNATVAFYGANPKPLDAVAKTTGPVLGIYAGEDQRINSDVPALVEYMIKYKKDFEMAVYKGAQHAFFNETMPVYDKRAAEDAWKKAVSFFNRHLYN